MSKNALIGIIVVIVLVIIGVAFAASSGSMSTSGLSATTTPDETSGDINTLTSSTTITTTTVVNPATSSATSTATSGKHVAEFTVSGSNFKFVPNTLQVSKGDDVKITFKNVEGFHDFKIEGYNVGTTRINGGQDAVVEFTADKAGTFTYYCSVGSHRQMGMQGTLTVK